MGRRRNFLSLLNMKALQSDASGAESLRAKFNARYNSFKRLLHANKRSLTAIVEIEEALRGAASPDMERVRELCAGAAADTREMIDNLGSLAPGKYDKLNERVRKIEKNVKYAIHPESVEKEGPLVLHLSEVDRDMVDQAGMKMANLGELRRHLRLTVPNGFVITAQAYRRFMEHNNLQEEIDRRVQSRETGRLSQLCDLSASVQQLIIHAAVPEDLEAAVMEQVRRLEDEEGRDVRMAVRSSAAGPGISKIAIPGQYISELNVAEESLLEVYKKVVASKFEVAAMTHRNSRGFRDADIAMCVGCIKMIDAVSGGVVYSTSPVESGENTIVIHSAWGLPKSVVEGRAGCDRFLVSREDPGSILEKEIAVKEHKFVCRDDGGVHLVETKKREKSKPSLKKRLVYQLAHLALELERYFGRPQDIEWAVDTRGDIVVLQCRPLKQVQVDGSREMGAMEAEMSGPMILKGGVSASPGAAAGPVFIVRKESDALDFPDGSVLVSVQPLQRLATLLNRAAALVTEQGGIAGHLASVARDMRLPALFSVKGASNRLYSGQLITVDASGRRVYEGRVQSILARRSTTSLSVQESPALGALKEAARSIVPLNLIDSDSKDFRPENCRTLHDIMRFCHEKAVLEMFRFGKDHEFPERSSKQLHFDVPMRWWVLNLDDGFKEDVKGRYVRLEDIVSIPMLALWEGITAVPWEGPPPVDGRGFMSVMFHATANSAIMPGVGSKLADRNYFMISKHYCSLNCRLGFHFSIVEALVGDNPDENYVTFQFKGGAADLKRRLERLNLVRDILEDHGFRADLREDHLIARMEGHDPEIMEKGLKILGYLTIHTRQLDMVMKNPSMVSYYRSKMKKEISEMIA